MNTKRTYITKTGYMKGDQCELAFFNWWNKVEEEYSDAAMGRMEEGNEVGILAQQLAPGGTDLNGLDMPLPKMAVHTQALMTLALPIYEATFITSAEPKLMCKVDILVPDKKGWQIWEVKATSQVKENHIKDLAFQTYVLEMCGVNVTRSSLVHLNKDYIRNGELIIKDLFLVEDITKQVRAALPEIANAIPEMFQKGQLPEAPQKNIGAHCSSPYTCSYQHICWKSFPEQNNIYTIPRLGNKAEDYLNNGLFQLSDIDPNILSEKQRLIYDAHINNAIIHDKETIAAFLDEKTYPHYFLDFETIMPAIPIWNDTKPYAQVPFQYSLHIIRNPGDEPEHFEYLDEASGNDPRPGLCDKLITDLGKSGTIWTYNKSFESARIKELIILFPKFEKELQNILDRMDDLLTPFRNLWYYHPDMQGSSSIKNVLPVLAPGLTYEGMEIGNGGEAMDIFLRLIKGDEELLLKKERIMNDLLEYCKMDTWAMVKVLEGLGR